MKAVDGNILLHLRAEILFKFQYDTESHCSELDLVPRLISIPPLRMLNYTKYTLWFGIKKHILLSSNARKNKL